MNILRIAILPLPDITLFPGIRLALHIFEPRYREMVRKVMLSDRQIGMIQPRHRIKNEKYASPGLYDVGCLGRIVDIKLLDDGKYNLTLEGTARFRIRRELEVTTPFRQIEAEIEEETQAGLALPIAKRAALEREARKFAQLHGYIVDWNSVGQIDDKTLVNGIAQIAPFDAAAKQALLEVSTVSERADLTMRLMQFFACYDGDSSRIILQ